MEDFLKIWKEFGKKIRKIRNLRNVVRSSSKCGTKSIVFRMQSDRFLTVYPAKEHWSNVWTHRWPLRKMKIWSNCVQKNIKFQIVVSQLLVDWPSFVYFIMSGSFVKTHWIINVQRFIKHAQPQPKQYRTKRSSI